MAEIFGFEQCLENRIRIAGIGRKSQLRKGLLCSLLLALIACIVDTSFPAVLFLGDPGIVAFNGRHDALLELRIGQPLLPAATEFTAREILGDHQFADLVGKRCQYLQRMEIICEQGVQVKKSGLGIALGHGVGQFVNRVALGASQNAVDIFP